jgi:diaminopimelate decarboxylase
MELTSLNSIETPCFILNSTELGRSIDGYRKALLNCFNDCAIGYSVKTNSLPYCLALAKKQGCYSEVVSDDEFELALLCGFEKSHIIYNGPMKSRETFINAITNGAIVNIETHRELEWLRDLPNDGHYKVGVRLNVNITRVSPEDADSNNDNSRFGFSDETDEFSSALTCINELPNLTLAGLHIHRTAHSRSIRFYRNSIRYACETIRKYGLILDYIDVGGGYFGIFPNKPTYQEYADAFKQVLAAFNLDGLRVIVEPGNAIVASCFSFLSEVIDVKHVEEDRWFLTTNGSRNDVDPFFRKSSYMTELLTEGRGEVVKEQIVSGCTCLEYDRLFAIEDKPLLKVGDRILYKNVGAYTMCLTPMFIRYIPKVYVWDGNEYKLIREKWTAHEYIQKSTIE